MAILSYTVYHAVAILSYTSHNDQKSEITTFRLTFNQEC